MALSVEEISKRFLAATTTGFAPHPERHKYHGFTCPNCGRHEFGTNSMPNGVSVGSCHGNSYSGNGCTFMWDRNKPEDEENVFYHQTPAEWWEQYEELQKQVAED